MHGDVPLVIAGSLGALWNLSLLPSNVEALLPLLPILPLSLLLIFVSVHKATSRFPSDDNVYGCLYAHQTRSPEQREGLAGVVPLAVEAMRAHHTLPAVLVPGLAFMRKSSHHWSWYTSIENTYGRQPPPPSYTFLLYLLHGIGYQESEQQQHNLLCIAPQELG